MKNAQLVIIGILLGLLLDAGAAAYGVDGFHLRFNVDVGRPGIQQTSTHK